MHSEVLAEGDDGVEPAPQAEKKEEAKPGRGGGRGLGMQWYIIALILVAFAIFQVAAYTAFRLAEFDSFTLESYLGLLKDTYFWVGLLCSAGVFLMSFTLVRVSESSLLLVLFLLMNSFLVYFVFLPLSWKVVFDEQIFTSSERSFAYFLALLSGIGLLASMYFWNKGGS